VGGDIWLQKGRRHHILKALPKAKRSHHMTIIKIMIINTNNDNNNKKGIIIMTINYSNDNNDNLKATDIKYSTYREPVKIFT